MREVNRSVWQWEALGRPAPYDYIPNASDSALRSY
jgi:hypothetical protein